MNGNADAALGWLRKAESDLAAAAALIDSGAALDAACFHCQQAAEKSLKAWLIAGREDFPLVHDLNKLLRLCGATEPGFNQLAEDAAELNPFAVEMRYDVEFWPNPEQAGEAIRRARRLYEFVRNHWQGH